MLDRPQSRDVASDRHVIGRISEHHVDPVGAEQPAIAVGVEGVAAQQAMVAQNPKVARPSDRGDLIVDGRQLVFLVEAVAIQNDVDLTHLKTAEFEVDLRIEFQNIGELQGQGLAVPAGVVGDPVERKPQYAQIGVGQIRQADRRHLAEAQMPRRQHQAPARHHPLPGIDHDRQDEPEPLEAGRKLAHLLRRVLAGLASKRLAAVTRDELGRQITGKDKIAAALPDRLIHGSFPTAYRSDVGGIGWPVAYLFVVEP